MAGDNLARDLSDEVLVIGTRLQLHEERCYELSKDTNEKLTGVVAKTDAIHARLDTMQAGWHTKSTAARNSVILVLLGIVGYLLTSGVPWTP